MKLAQKCFFRHVHDPMQMPAAMQDLEEELISQGYKLKPRSGPVVILVLEDGEVHYVPGDGGIWQYIFEYEGENA